MPVIKAPVGPSDQAPQTYKQPSRKGKKSWRKNVDVSEVQDGLEQLNDEIIKGGVVAERASDELFTLDTAGDSAAVRKHFPKKKGLKVDELLAARSSVPAVDTRKRPGPAKPDSSGGKTTDGVVPAKRQRTGYVSQKELARLRMVADGQRASDIAVTDATYDPWGAGPGNADAQRKEAQHKSLSEKAESALFKPDPESWIPREEKAKAPDSMRQAPITLTASGKVIPAVKKPGAGYSYNPDFAAYEARYRAEGAKAVASEERRLAELAEEKRRLEAAARSAAEADAAEARANLSEWDEDESAWEGAESGGEELGAASKKRQPRRKTQVQRNKIKRRKEAEATAKHEAKMRQRRDEENRIKSIAKEVAEREQVLAAARKRAAGEGAEAAAADGREIPQEVEEGEEEELRRKQLGKFRLPERDLELVLPDELQDSLRLLKPEGNLLKDRYRSMLVRGRVESRRRIPFRKQPKTKYTEKWTHKDFRLE